MQPSGSFMEETKTVLSCCTSRRIVSITFRIDHVRKSTWGMQVLFEWVYMYKEGNYRNEVILDQHVCPDNIQGCLARLFLFMNKYS